MVTGFRLRTQLKLENDCETSEIFRDYEVVKGGMDDVFLAVTGKILGGGQ